VLDVRLPRQSGLDLQRELAAANRELPIIFITGHGDIPMSVQAMKGGAIEFLTKPFRDQDLLDAIQPSINLSDDPELMRRMRDANFFGVFVGIESPDPMTLTLMKKKQNTRRNIAESIHKSIRTACS
jgi:DNA-binding NtrC family response regulator